MALRTQIKRKAGESIQGRQIALVEELVAKFEEPLRQLFAEASKLEKSYKKAETEIEVSEGDSQRLALDKYKHDRTLYVNTLTSISKYMYATIKQIEIQPTLLQLPELRVRVEQ